MAWGTKPSGADLWKLGVARQKKTPATAAGGFTPFQAPTQAPIGSYDPAFDAQLENAQQGFAWAGQDFDTGNLRRDNDYGTNTGRLNSQYDLATGRQGEDYNEAKQYLGEDYGTSKQQLGEDRASSLADLLTARTRGQEDYGRATSDLGRSYTRLGDSQRQNAQAAGVAGGGALAQALMKRKENQAHDQSGIDMQNTRFMDDNTLATGRTNQQYDRQGQALETSYTRSGSSLDKNNARGLQDLLTGRSQGLEDLGRGYFREGQDANTAFTRAGVQNETFGRQINAQTLGIAAQNGALPTAPANEHTYKGITYRNETHNGKQYRRLPNGRLVPITQKLASAV